MHCSMVLPSDHPDCDFEFTDSFEITGGTGRFEGAAGWLRNGTCLMAAEVP